LRFGSETTLTADLMKERILKWAGSHGSKGYEDGHRNSAKFNGPIGIAIDRDGDLFVCEPENRCIRKVSGYDGTVSTFARIDPKEAIQSSILS
jgi:sugar lactone lactonase YvrE